MERNSGQGHYPPEDASKAQRLVRAVLGADEGERRLLERVLRARRIIDAVDRLNIRMPFSACSNRFWERLHLAEDVGFQVRQEVSRYLEDGETP